MNQHETIEAAPLWANVAASVTRRLPVGRYRLIHWLCHGRNKTFLGTMPSKLGGHKFQCSFHDIIARDVFFSGCYEPQETLFLQSVLRPGMSFVDVGANWGFFTLMAAHQVGPSGKVVAVEADPRIFLKLKQNIESNHLSHVTILDVAVADRDSRLLLAGHDESEENWGISRLVEAGTVSAITFDVCSRRLDPLLDEAGLNTVDLVKIDVEGAEDLVLAGMDAGLNKHRYRCILMELHPQQLAERGRMIEELIALLTGKGYTGWTLDHSHTASRKARYNSRARLSEFIRPLAEVFHDPWPHTIWTCPGVKLNAL